MDSGQPQNQWSTVHGVLVDVLDIGILISGKSGIGKSECALDLVRRGHRLVVDDLIELRRTSSDSIVGSGSEIIRHSMEVRGVGVIDVEALFGISAVLNARRVDLVIEMEEWDPQMEYERLGMEQLSTEFLGVAVPLVRVPVSPGRNMATIVEVAARNQILLRRGRNSALELEKRILKKTTSALPDGEGRGIMKGMLRMLIVTGLSGSGKSSALRVLEDAGFFCVDNLPIQLLPKFYELCLNSPEISRSAIVMDIREGVFLKEYPGIFDELRQSGIPFEILFLDASDQVLERRFDQTRRPHPLSMTGTIRDGIVKERDRLADLRHMADMVVDTSKFTIQDLNQAVTERYVAVSDGRSMTISVVSFGFSLGIPYNSDLVIDVRFLPNPYYIDALRDRSGLEEAVGEYILSFDETRNFLARFGNLLELLLPLYEREGKVHLVLATGCTGGRHRSVFVAERLKEYLEERSYTVRIEHRDLEKAGVNGRRESRMGD